jgi:hypothetical protein
VSADPLSALVMGMYTNEPCRICRRMILPEDLDGLIFAGYSEDNTSRAAHGKCWQGFLEIASDMGLEGLA